MSRVEMGNWDKMRGWAAPIRTTVFVNEQRVPVDMEIDEWDERSMHAVAFDKNGAAVGTGRLLPDGHIGRMAVLAAARGTGVGSALLEAMMDEARRRGHRRTVLSAQTHAVGFYQRHGFFAFGSEYMDAGIPHVDMQCVL